MRLWRQELQPPLRLFETDFLAAENEEIGATVIFDIWSNSTPLVGGFTCLMMPLGYNLRSVTLWEARVVPEEVALAVLTMFKSLFSLCYESDFYSFFYLDSFDLDRIRLPVMSF